MDSPAHRLTRIVAANEPATDGHDATSTPETTSFNIDSNVNPSSAADPAQLRHRAAARVAAAYGAAHGHPTEHSGFAPAAETSGRRWAVRPRTAVAVAVGVALIVAAVGFATLRGSSGSVDLGSVLSPSAQASRSASRGAPVVATPDGVVVHVVGQVARPGLVKLPAGSRVSDAIQAAGGPTDSADVAALNLARLLVDGEQIVVPAPGEAPVAVPAGGEGAPEAGNGACVNINAADAAALDELPGVGPVLADRIVEWRTENGRFASVEDLGQVSGIGPGVLAKIGDKACV